jgi:hypothetical protein
LILRVLGVHCRNFGIIERLNRHVPPPPPLPPPPPKQKPLQMLLRPKQKLKLKLYVLLFICCVLLFECLYMY